MSQYTSRCPHCKNVVRSGHGAQTIRLGTPVRTCVHCTRPYIDESYLEWAVCSNGSKLVYIFINNNRWAWLLLVGLLLMIPESLLFGIILEIILLATYYWYFHNYHKEDVEASRCRASDIAYVDFLASIDYSPMDQAIYDEAKARIKSHTGHNSPFG